MFVHLYQTKNPSHDPGVDEKHDPEGDSLCPRGSARNHKTIPNNKNQKRNEKRFRPARGSQQPNMSKNYNKEDNLPIATAVPIHEAAAARADSLYVVELPVECGDLGIKFNGSPPRISFIAEDSPIKDAIAVGHYVHSLIVSEVEVFNIMDPLHLESWLKANTKNPRQLLVSSNRYYVDQSIGPGPHHGTRYKHPLPATLDLGFTVSGFPPVIHSVLEHSPLQGRLIAGQTVEALVVPGLPVMNLQAGGFRADKLHEQLIKTANTSGRQIIVTDFVPRWRP